MASLRRATYVYHTHPETGKRCPKDTPGAVRHQGRSAVWRGRYTDEHGNHVEVNLSENKETARRMLAELQRNAELARVGLGDPYARHRRRPLAEHVEEFAAALAAAGRAAVRVRKVRQQLLDVFAEARATLLEHVTGIAVERAVGALAARRDARPALPPQASFGREELAALLGRHRDTVSRAARRLGFGGRRGERTELTPEEAAAVRDALPGFGAGTANNYLAACKQFTRAMVADRRMAADPLSHLKRREGRADVRRRRRALPPGDFARLCEAAGQGPPAAGLSGPQRLVLYVAAANTGLRASELASLTPASFDWQALAVTVEARVSKRRREDVQVLRPDVAALLRAYVEANGISHGPLWPGEWWRDAAAMLRRDLEAAGIPYVQNGRVFDFHALRGQFVSQLAAAGVHPRVAQELARHSDVRLTMAAYTDLGLLDVRGALDKLPRLPGACTQPPESAGAG